MIVNADNHQKAEEIARVKSGLGSFESWNFEAIEMQVRNNRK